MEKSPIQCHLPVYVPISLILMGAVSLFSIAFCPFVYTKQGQIQDRITALEERPIYTKKDVVLPTVVRHTIVPEVRKSDLDALKKQVLSLSENIVSKSDFDALQSQIISLSEKIKDSIDSEKTPDSATIAQIDKLEKERDSCIRNQSRLQQLLDAAIRYANSLETSDTSLNTEGGRAFKNVEDLGIAIKENNEKLKTAEEKIYQLRKTL